MTQEKPWWEDKEFYQIDNLGDAIELDIEAIIAEATRRAKEEMGGYLLANIEKERGIGPYFDGRHDTINELVKWIEVYKSLPI